MLILERKAGEKIIMNDIVITYLGNNHKNGRFAIEAPSHIKILRGELVEKSKETQIVKK